MYAFKSTERHLTLLKIPFGLKKSQAGKKGIRLNAYSKYLNTNQDPTGKKLFSYGRYQSNQRQIKVKRSESRPLTTSTVTNIPLLNPNKPDPKEFKDLIIKPIVPLTLPRFPKTAESFPSVTKILQATMPAASQFILDRWKEAMIKKLGAAGFAKYQLETFERGRILHSLVANYLMGQGSPGEISKDIVANLWKSIAGVIAESISNVRLVEHVVTHSDMKYRGIVDCVAFYKDELVVIDFKTAEKPKKSISSLFDNPLQVTAYCAAINNDKNIPTHVIDRNICSGLVIVAYIDGSAASVYYLDRDQVINNYWKQWTMRIDQYSKMGPMVNEQEKPVVKNV